MTLLQAECQKLPANRQKLGKKHEMHSFSQDPCFLDFQPPELWDKNLCLSHQVWLFYYSTPSKHKQYILFPINLLENYLVSTKIAQDDRKRLDLDYISGDFILNYFRINYINNIYYIYNNEYIIILLTHHLWAIYINFYLNRSFLGQNIS